MAPSHVEFYAVEAAGKGIETGKHAASLSAGEPGVLHGNRTYLLQDNDGQITAAHSISAGLDYPGIGPEHSWLHDIGRVNYVSVKDHQALEAFQLCSQLEGIIPALEPAHALAHGSKIAPGRSREAASGRNIENIVKRLSNFLSPPRRVKCYDFFI